MSAVESNPHLPTMSNSFMAALEEIGSLASSLRQAAAARIVPSPVQIDTRPSHPASPICDFPVADDIKNDLVAVGLPLRVASQMATAYRQEADELRRKDLETLSHTIREWRASPSSRGLSENDFLPKIVQAVGEWYLSRLKTWKTHALDLARRWVIDGDPSVQHKGHEDTYSQETLRLLEAAYSRRQKDLTPSERTLICSKTGLSERQVMVWFQNRRQRGVPRILSKDASLSIERGATAFSHLSPVKSKSITPARDSSGTRKRGSASESGRPTRRTRRSVDLPGANEQAEFTGSYNPSRPFITKFARPRSEDTEESEPSPQRIRTSRELNGAKQEALFTGPYASFGSATSSGSTKDSTPFTIPTTSSALADSGTLPLPRSKSQKRNDRTPVSPSPRRPAQNNRTQRAVGSLFLSDLLPGSSMDTPVIVHDLTGMEVEDEPKPESLFQRLPSLTYSVSSTSSDDTEAVEMEDDPVEGSVIPSVSEVDVPAWLRPCEDDAETIAPVVDLPAWLMLSHEDDDVAVDAPPLSTSECGASPSVELLVSSAESHYEDTNSLFHTAPTTSPAATPAFGSYSPDSTSPSTPSASPSTVRSPSPASSSASYVSSEGPRTPTSVMEPFKLEKVEDYDLGSNPIPLCSAYHVDNLEAPPSAGEIDSIIALPAWLTNDNAE